MSDTPVLLATLSVQQRTQAQRIREITGQDRRNFGLGRPLVDRIEGSRHHNMKELRPGSAGRSEIRVLFVFDPERRAVLLVAGDKAGNWSRWYSRNISVADGRYDEWLRGERDL